MPTSGFPTRLIIDGRFYKIGGEAERQPRWAVRPVAAQIGEFESPRVVQLGDASAGIVGSRRRSGRPSSEGISDSVDGDTSYEDRIGAGPLVNIVSLATGNSIHNAGTIGGSLVIGGGAGSPSIGGSALSDTPTAIWSDGLDDNASKTRYIYTLQGGRLKVVNPITDTVIDTIEWEGVDGGDAAYWAGVNWVALRGNGGDTVKYVRRSHSPSQTTSLSETDFTATSIHAGPDALYRAYSDFTGNVALIKKSDAVVASGVALDTNWSPSSGETAGEPSTPITNLGTLGERLVIGKQDGLGEMDVDFTFRHYLEWMAAFRWDKNCNLLIPIGSAGEVIVGFRRGLYYLPVNKVIGTEVLAGNDSDKKGRYTTGTFDGNWLYVFQESPATDDTHLIKMRPRRLPGPGLFEHHPVATLTDTEVLSCFLWPGATISGTSYGPRLYFGNGADSLAYIRLGETQPDQDDSNARFTDDWSVTWPLDDFGSPGTRKFPYKLESFFENVDDTDGITWSVSTDGSTFEELTEDGTGLHDAAVVVDGFHQRFGPKTNSLRGRELAFRVAGSGGAATAQQRIAGMPVLYLLEQPEMVSQITTTLQLESYEMNDESAEVQWRTLYGLKGQGPREIVAEWGDSEPGTTFIGHITEARRVGTVAASESAGVIVTELIIRAMDFEDSGP